MKTLVLSIAVAGIAAAMAMTAPTDPGRTLDGAPAPLLKVGFAR
jgi:hypothetical protein